MLKKFLGFIVVMALGIAPAFGQLAVGTKDTNDDPFTVVGGVGTSTNLSDYNNDAGFAAKSAYNLFTASSNRFNLGGGDLYITSGRLQMESGDIDLNGGQFFFGTGGVVGDKLSMSGNEIDLGAGVLNIGGGGTITDGTFTRFSESGVYDTSGNLIVDVANKVLQNAVWELGTNVPVAGNDIVDVDWVTGQGYLTAPPLTNSTTVELNALLKAGDANAEIRFDGDYGIFVLGTRIMDFASSILNVSGSDPWESQGTLDQIDNSDLNIVNYGAMTNWVTQNSGGGDVFLANNQTFSGTNTFTNGTTTIVLNQSSGIKAYMLDTDNSLQIDFIDNNNGHAMKVYDGFGGEIVLGGSGLATFTEGGRTVTIDPGDVNTSLNVEGFGHVTSNASQTTEIVNYQTMTNWVTDQGFGTGDAVLGSYNVFTSSNLFEDVTIIDQGRIKQEVVEVTTNDVQLTLDDGGKVYMIRDNALGDITFSLPTNATESTIGTDFRFINLTTNLLIVDAATTDFIDDSGYGSQIYSGVDQINDWPYSSITLKQGNSNWWHTLAARGDWTTTGSGGPYNVPSNSLPVSYGQMTNYVADNAVLAGNYNTFTESNLFSAVTYFGGIAEFTSDLWVNPDDQIRVGASAAISPKANIYYNTASSTVRVEGDTATPLMFRSFTVHGFDADINVSSGGLTLSNGNIEVLSGDLTVTGIGYVSNTATSSTEIVNYTTMTNYVTQNAGVGDVVAANYNVFTSSNRFNGDVHWETSDAKMLFDDAEGSSYVLWIDDVGETTRAVGVLADGSGDALQVTGDITVNDGGVTVSAGDIAVSAGDVNITGFATVSSNATTGTEVVNYQTMTAYVPEIREGTHSAAGSLKTNTFSSAMSAAPAVVASFGEAIGELAQIEIISTSTSDFTYQFRNGAGIATNAWTIRYIAAEE